MATAPWWGGGSGFNSYPITTTYYYDSNEVVILDHEQIPYLVTFGTPAALINNKIWYEGSPPVHMPKDLAIDEPLYNMLNDPYSLTVVTGDQTDPVVHNPIKMVIALQGGIPATLEL